MISTASFVLVSRCAQPNAPSPAAKHLGPPSTILGLHVHQLFLFASSQFVRLEPVCRRIAGRETGQTAWPRKPFQRAAFHIHLPQQNVAVYLVAKPIHALSGAFDFLSDGKFPVCHWGFVLSQYNQDQLKESIVRIRRLSRLGHSSKSNEIRMVKRLGSSIWMISLVRCLRRTGVGCVSATLVKPDHPKTKSKTLVNTISRA